MSSIRVIITDSRITSGIAIFYDERKNAAPMIVAKGEHDIAIKIHDIAKSYKISIIKNTALAHALYGKAAINNEIGENFYPQVAEIFAYVFKYGGKDRNVPDDIFDGLDI